MEKNLYIDASHPDETRVVLKSKSHIEEYEYENKNKLKIKNNIYLGKVSRVEPSLQAAFINFGRLRHGFLAFNDIQTEYYQIPHDDKERLIKEEKKLREEIKEESKKVEENTDENSPILEKNLPQENNENETIIKNTPVEPVNKLNNLKQRYGTKRYKIQEVIKPGQVLLIQVLKDERGQKGAALTTFISLAGRYTVLMPNTSKGGGISKKIYGSEDRKKIRDVLQQIAIPENMGLIVRTAGANKTKNEINNDLTNTINLWEKIKTKAINSIAPSLIHEEGNIIKRALRDIYDNDTKNIHVEGNEGYQEAKNFVKLFMPQNSKFIKKYRGQIPLFHNAGIEKELNKIFDHIIWLHSGGYIVINPTEALIAIDINSGKSTKEANLERTALVTNIEAAEEIARQIKIRDLSGLIVIDFIDMLNYHNRRTVERKLKEKLKDDRAKIQFGKISNFGLLEMTRQRMRESSVKWNMTLSLDSFSLKVIKSVEEVAFSVKTKTINVSVPPKVKMNIEKSLDKELSYFKKKYKFEINLIADNKLIIPEYKIELLNKNNKIVKKVEKIEKLEKDMPENKQGYSYLKHDPRNKVFSKNKGYYHNKKKFNYRNKPHKNNWELKP